MIDSPTTANLQDFKQRYSGVLGWYISQDDKSRTLVTVSNVSSERVTFKDQVGGTYYANVNGGVQFEFLPVEKGWHNTQEHCYFLSRIPARQWKRGICADNTSIRRGDVILGLSYGEVDTWAGSIFKVFSYTGSVINCVREFMEGKRNSVALSNHFALVQGRILLHNIIIGSYHSDNKKLLILEKDIMVQELTDTLRRLNLHDMKVVTQ